MDLRLKKIRKVMNFLHIVVSLTACTCCFFMIDRKHYGRSHRRILISLAGLFPGSLLLSAWINSCLLKGAARQISALEEEKDRYRDYALKDALTGAYSRLYYELKDGRGRPEFLADMHGPLTVILIDIDGFKYINDTYGHLAGDKVLQHLVRVIQDNITEKDRLVRYGGDEFLLILSSYSEEKLDLLMTKINRSVNDSAVKTPIGLSYGIYRLKEGESMELAVCNADKIMYTKKGLKKINERN